MNEGTEGTQVVEPGDNGTEGTDSGTKLTYEELQSELAKVRREAASRRVLTREQEAQIKEYETWKESQMTELEKAQTRASKLEEERRGDLVELAIAKFGLEDEDADLLSGKTKEEIFASAKRIAERFKKGTEGAGGTQPQNPNLFPGTRGNPVGSGRPDANEALRALLQGRK